jgi:hypothetical protein
LVPVPVEQAPNAISLTTGTMGETGCGTNFLDATVSFSLGFSSFFR